MEKHVIDPKTVNGWGVDADPKNEPTYPIKHYTGDDHERVHWQRPEQQHLKVEVLMSTERPYITAVFGSKVPPRGLSGAMRRLAFKYGENKYRHWLPLLMADRIDALESFFGDIFLRGTMPNPIGERGWPAIAKYKPVLFIRKVLVRLIILAIIVTLVIYFINKHRR